MKSEMKRMLGIMLSIVMMFGLMPVLGMTAEAEEEKFVAVYKAVNGSDEYIISEDVIDPSVEDSYRIECLAEGGGYLDFIIQNSFGDWNWESDKGSCVDEAPVVEGNIEPVNAVTAGLDESGDFKKQFIKISNKFEGSVNVTGKYMKGEEQKEYSFKIECGNYIPAESLSITPNTTQTIYKDDVIKFTANIAPDNATDKWINWNVGGTNKDSVKLYLDEECKEEVPEYSNYLPDLPVYAKAVSVGTATVVATNWDSELTASCTVTVAEKETPTPAPAPAPETTSVYRVYNPNSGEHFFTTSATEKNNLVSVGWRYEGLAWSSPKSGTPVLRLYNPNAGDHHYTTSAAEKNNLVKAGWRYEGVAFYSGGSKPLYRAYNPNAVSGAHHFTLSKAEKDHIVKVGWRYEGVAFYAN